MSDEAEKVYRELENIICV